MYFCALEAMTNAAKYAEAASVAVTLGQSDSRLSFSVTDDGRGFDPADAPRGSGLQGMTDRVEAVGGTLTVQSTPGRGTSVLGTLPVQGPARPPGDVARTS